MDHPAAMGVGERVQHRYQRLDARLHLRQLQAEITSLIRAESARGSRSGFMVNTLFYALGVATSILVDFVKAHGSFW